MKLSNFNPTTNDAFDDTEVESWFLMGSVIPVASIITLYLSFVLKIGPLIMRNRRPFVLKNVLLVYNFTMTIFNVYMFIQFLVLVDYPREYLCFPKADRNVIPATKILRNVSWVYMIAKITELLDTVFFVLRKKQSQTSVLHVYHHAVILAGAWYFTKYLKTEQGMIVGFLNTFVHIIMYFYYFLTALGSESQKILWWKKYITVLQMSQFVTFLIYLVTLLVLKCEVHPAMSSYMLWNSCFFFFMFLNFYRNTYRKKK